VAEALRRVVASVLERLGAPRDEVHVLMTGDERIRELNRTYRHLDAPTDVLSFPDGATLPEGHRLLGQIVVSLDTARRQAAELGHDECRELEELVLHGALHLMGYDHAMDDGEMNQLELELREEILR
jgi:probable rRNA maturation factor